ncbi:MAG: hypothetical protein A3H98_00065 [Bacteroidetes bacterium RIFCSPLOWO2_02_FULL_36_8]|nr:MAG: hypothetical protein A3H98_00065 [Bacteroidetes bacterium RIFCSPLOWO2_02_FULL_36_8]OFY69805.1 MAG: hypothetical protein A3G23_14440 [Bacteroidetes bacterium RIFCSPLOWO2_12_FULL_37_12]
MSNPSFLKSLFLISGAILGFLGVILGAFASHRLKQTISPEQLISFETGVRYQMYHALALILTGLLIHVFRGNFLDFAGICFLSGTLLFSGSIYLLVLKNWKFLWPITPLGGVILIIGWFLLILRFVTQKLTI